MLKIIRCVIKNFDKSRYGSVRFYSSTDQPGKKESDRLKEFRKKLQNEFSSELLGQKKLKSETYEMKKPRVKVPIIKINEFEENKHPDQEKEPLKPFPNNINPATGEFDGPKGPEPTRYGDWERKGRVSDF